jgi:cytochrome c oxidase cbb3-type subunit III
MNKTLCLLSAPRRFFLAVVVAILSLAGATRAGFMAQVQAHSQPQRKSPDASAADAKKTFESICAGCHGLDGRGGERGPDIATRQEVRQRSDAALLQILEKGRPSRGMPAFSSFGGERLRQMLVYLRSLQGGSKAVALPGDAQRGKLLFFGKAGCSECHMMGGSGGFLGSDLSVYGNGRSAVDIRNAILNVNKDPDPRIRVLLVTLRDSSTLTGIARNEDNFTLQLQSFDGTFHFLHKSGIAHLEVQPHSPMPSNYDSLLTSAQLDDLAKYLVQAGKENSQSSSANPAKNDDGDDR